MLLGHVLIDAFAVEHVKGETSDPAVRVETERQIDVAVAFIRLLIEIDGPHAILHFFEIWSDIDHIVHAPHIAQQTDEAALGEFCELFGNPHLVQTRLGKVVTDENVSRYPCDVFLDQGITVDEVVHAVRRKDVL